MDRSFGLKTRNRRERKSCRNDRTADQMQVLLQRQCVRTAMSLCSSRKCLRSDDHSDCEFARAGKTKHSGLTRSESNTNR